MYYEQAAASWRSDSRLKDDHPLVRKLSQPGHVYAESATPFVTFLFFNFPSTCLESQLTTLFLKLISAIINSSLRYSYAFYNCQSFHVCRGPRKSNINGPFEKDNIKHIYPLLAWTNLPFSLPHCSLPVRAHEIILNMPEFLNFPLETTRNISSYLNRKDLRALRQICRRVEQHTYDGWVAECFTDVYVLPTRYALDKLCSISKNDRIRPTLRHVHIVSSLYSTCEKHQDYYHPIVWHEDYSYRPFPIPRYAWQQSVNTHLDFMASGRLREVLVRALAAFRTIELSVLKDFEAPDDVCLWGRAEELRRTNIDPCPARGVLWNWEPSRTTLQTRMGAIVLGICQTMPVTKLTLGEVQLCYLPRFDVRRADEVQAFIHLRSLSIAPSLNRFNNLLNSSSNYSVPRDHEDRLCRLLAAVPNLQNLTLVVPAPFNLMHFLNGASDTFRRLHFEVNMDRRDDDAYELRPWIDVLNVLLNKFTLLPDVSFGGFSELADIFARVPKSTETGEKKDVTTVLNEYIRLLELTDEDKWEDEEGEGNGEEI